MVYCVLYCVICWNKYDGCGWNGYCVNLYYGEISNCIVNVVYIFIWSGSDWFFYWWGYYLLVGLVCYFFG